MNSSMRKAEREISDPAQIAEILNASPVLHLAMCSDGQPYLVPLNFAYQGGSIYLHTGVRGLKMDYLRANPRVCFEVCVDVNLAPAQKACAWSCHYRSVIGFGRVVELSDPDQRAEGLLAVVKRYAGPGQHEMAAEALARTTVLRVDIESMTGKRHLAPGGLA